MNSHAPAPATLIAGRFGSQHAELQQLMPGLRAARRSAAAQAHGLDVLYQNQQARLHAVNLLELQEPAPLRQGADAPASPAPLLLGLVVELELQQPSAEA